VGAGRSIAGATDIIASRKTQRRGLKHWIDGSKRAQPAHGWCDANNISSRRGTRGLLPPVLACHFSRFVDQRTRPRV
jgi:hypothetical protein